jgi:phage terminase small subunit
MNELNKNQKAFCQEYMKNGMNGTKAYMKVYKTKDEDKAGASASRLLGNVKIQEYINSLQKELENKAIVTAEDIIKELSIIAFSNGSDFAKVEKQKVIVGYSKDGIPIEREIKIADIYETKDIPEDKRKAISNIKQTKHGLSVESYDKVKALELLGKYIGMFNDKQDITINNNVENPYKELSTEELKKLAGE